MKIDSNMNQGFDIEQTPADPTNSAANTAVPAVQTDSIDGPIGQVQQGLHSENADGTNRDAWSDYQVGTGFLLGVGSAAGFGWGGLLALADPGLPSAVGNLVDNTFDAVGGTVDSAGQGIGGVP